MSLSSFVQHVQARGLDLHGVRVVPRHGEALEAWWSPYRPKARHVLYSLTKTFTALGVLFAVQEGALSLDEFVVRRFPRWAPRDGNDRWHRVTVRHLLTMSLGFDVDPTDRVVKQRDWVKAVLALSLDHEPGSRFVYNNMASYLASAVLQEATGTTLREWLMRQLFEPLGIADPPWDRCPTGRTIGGWGLYLTLEEVSRLGVFLRDRGSWNGRSLLKPSLVDEATSFHIATGTNPDHDSHQGYGYQIWRCRHGAFRADGAFGQHCVVWPERDLIVAVQAGVGDTQPVLDLIWEHWGTELGAWTGTELAHAPPPLNEPIGSALERWEGWRDRAWSLTDHPAGWTEIGLSGASGGSSVPVFWYRDDRGRHEAAFGWGQWVESRSGLWRHEYEKRRRFINLVSARWEGQSSLVLTLRFPEQAPVVTLTLTREGEALSLSQHLSVTMRPTNFEGIRGTPCTP